MPCVSIEDISFVLSRRFLFDTVIIDYVELMDFVKGVECLKRSEELRAIWHFLDTVAQKKNIRVIGLSQLGIQFDATNSECLDNVLKYLKRDYVRERLIVLHRPSYYELQKDDIEPVQLITLKRIIPYTMKMTPWKKK
jgi:replicative DNA helicase